MASGTLPVYKKGIPEGGLPGRDVWAGLQCPVFLVAGEADHVTTPEELKKITSFLGKSHPLQNEIKHESEAIADSAAPISLSNVPVSNVFFIGIIYLHGFMDSSAACSSAPSSRLMTGLDNY